MPALICDTIINFCSGLCKSVLLQGPRKC